MTYLTKKIITDEIINIKTRFQNNIHLYNHLAQQLIEQGDIEYPAPRYYDNQLDQYISYDELPDNWYDLDRYSEEYPEIYQYYLVTDSYIVNLIERSGGIIISGTEVDFFCRECCGQSIWLDDLFKDCVINHITNLYFANNYAKAFSKIKAIFQDKGDRKYLKYETIYRI